MFDYDDEEIIQSLKSDKAWNVIINKHKDFTEIVERKQVLHRTTPKEDIDRSRKFYYDEHGELQKFKEETLWNSYIDSVNRSRKRSVDTFIAYALNNDWDYFYTLTFDKRKVNRSCDDDVKLAFYKFRKILQYRYPGIKILNAVERHHTDGCLHFHGFIGECDITSAIKPAMNNMKYLNHYDSVLKKKVYDYDLLGNLIPNKYYGTWLTTKNGLKIYNFRPDIYKYGFSSLIKIDAKDSISKRKITNYLLKYMDKETYNVGYCKKAYYKTNNLKSKQKIVTKAIDMETGQVLNELLSPNLQLIKSTDSMNIYHIENDGVDYSIGNIYEDNLNELILPITDEKEISDIMDIFDEIM